MLVEFSVENFRSFKDKVTFSMLASDDASHEDANVVTMPDGKRLLKSAVIYGANASGKSNLLMAMDFMSDLLFNSRHMNPSEPINVTPYKLCPEFKDKPSKFDIVFYCDDVKYAYGFVATRTEITEEYLHRFIDNSDESENIFTRDRSLPDEYDFVNVPDPDVLKYLCQFNADNKLYLSTAVLFNYKDFINLYNWLCGFRSYHERDAHRILGKSYYDNDAAFEKSCVEKAVKWVMGIDVGITNVSIKDPLLLFENDASTGNGRRDKYAALLDSIVSSHTVKREDGMSCDVEFNFYDEESEGTTCFFDMALSIAAKMLLDRIFIVDELDNSMHPHLSKHVVALFHVKDDNIQSQLISTTHDTNLLDLNIFRRDQIWFAEKNPDTGATDIYSLYDFGERRDVDVEKGYLSGIYGAIPFIGGNLNG